MARGFIVGMDVLVWVTIAIIVAYFILSYVVDKFGLGI